MTPPPEPLDGEALGAHIRALADNLGTVIRGKAEKIDLVLLAVLGGGHLLVEDIPGVGKTTLARALARSVDGSFRRIQFTPDLLPTDITGVNVFSPEAGSFHFKPGPIFTHFLLADEINRASPRTQSALLEAMGEGQVTVDGTSHPLPSPFVVIATQNPVEYHGTYPLPEAQLDRFMIQADLGYPPPDQERALLVARTRANPVDAIEPVLSLEDCELLRTAVDRVRLDPAVADYMLRIVEATRQHPQLQLGVSTRGTLLYGRVVRARALCNGRAFVIPEDVKELAVPTLAHRVALDSKAKYEGIDRAGVIAAVVERTAVPR